jgi:predicted Zn-dependent protease
VRNQEKEKALKALKTAAELEPETAPYQYVYAIAVAEKQPKHAIKILVQALQKHTGNIELLMALASYYQQLGDQENSLKYRKQAESVLQYKP